LPQKRATHSRVCPHTICVTLSGPCSFGGLCHSSACDLLDLPLLQRTEFLLEETDL
jgi:hypothetical protein